MEEKKEKSLGWYALQRIEDIGRIDKLLLHITENDIFDNLSKYNSYFDSQHEIENEKLGELRLKLAQIYEQIWEVHSIISRFEE